MGLELGNVDGTKWMILNDMPRLLSFFMLLIFITQKVMSNKIEELSLYNMF